MYMQSYTMYLPPKAKSNYRGHNRKSSNPNFFIHFFIDNSNANISLHALSCPNFNLGQLKAYKLTFALGTMNLRRRQIFTIFDPTIGILGKCL